MTTENERKQWYASCAQMYVSGYHTETNDIEIGQFLSLMQRVRSCLESIASDCGLIVDSSSHSYNNLFTRKKSIVEYAQWFAERYKILGCPKLDPKKVEKLTLLCTPGTAEETQFVEQRYIERCKQQLIDEVISHFNSLRKRR